MPQNITKTQRWLDLLAFLLGRRLPVSVEQIMEGVPAYAADWEDGDDTARASVRRKFERDKDELREIGIPLETVPYEVFGEREAGYRLARRDFYLPYLKLIGAGSEEDPAGSAAAPSGGSDDHPRQSGAGELSLSPSDAGAALDALWRVEGLPRWPYASEARSAFRKLSGDLDLERFRRPPVLHLDPSRTEEIEERLHVLAEALNARKRVRFTYHGIHRDEETRRDVAPYGLVFQGSHWYLVGYDALRDDLRVLRVSRMRDLEPNRTAPRTPDYEIPGDFELDDLLGREAWELGSDGEGEIAARVRFAFPLSLWAERGGHGELESEEAGGAAVRRFRIRQVHPFLRWVLTFEGQAEILEPLELRDGLRAMAREVAERHEAPRPPAGEEERDA
ncbi:MAG: WYL domain-containing protein [Gemmatimonadota bacterium]|nr:WYL domain-containing protein [Gemmatimonadota bacterium]